MNRQRPVSHFQHGCQIPGMFQKTQKQLGSKDISESLENACYKLGMAVYSYNPNTQNVEAGESGVEANPKLHKEDPF